MNLTELAAEYRQSGEKCRDRAKLLHTRLSREEISETDKLLLRRRCRLLEDMARETIAISRYLESYYGKGDAKNP